MKNGICYIVGAGEDCRIDFWVILSIREECCKMV